MATKKKKTPATNGFEVYQVILCSCDGGRIGKTYNQWLYTKKRPAENKLTQLVKEHDEKELNRELVIKRGIKEGHFRTYHKDKVENIDGYCCWCYAMMLYLQKVEVNDV